MADCKAIMCDANSHFEAHLKTIQGSKWKEPTQRFALDYLRQIFSIIHKLETMTYKTGAQGEFMLHERGRARPVTTLGAVDREVRHVLCDDILMPAIMPKLIYDNGASIPGRGMAHARKRFEAHLHKYFMEHGNNEGYILFGDFRKFYDNVLHELVKRIILELFDYDPYLEWLLDEILRNFQIDVSYMTDEQFKSCLNDIFDKNAYRRFITDEMKTGEKFMAKSLNIGDQFSQVVGVYYPNRIDTYIKYVRQLRYYGRYMDDFYIMHESREFLEELAIDVEKIALDLGIHLNMKKTYVVRMDSEYRYLQVKYTLTKTGHIIKRINPKRVTTMRRRLRKIAVKVEAGETPYEMVEEMFRSWMGDFYKLMSKIQRQHLIELYEQLFHKKIVIRRQSGKWKMIFLDEKY